LSCDIGVASTAYLLEQTRAGAAREHLTDPVELKRVLKDALIDLLTPLAKPLVISGDKPYVMLVTGVNGSGKTTSIGKLAKFYQSQGHKVMLAAGDTFRAAAVEQLKTWGERNDVPVIAQEKGDPSAVIFDAVQSAQARGIDLLIADTAGRLPTQLHLMDELKKVKRVVRARDAGRSARSHAGARCQYRTEHSHSGESIRRCGRAHRPHRHQTRRHGEGRGVGCDRAPKTDSGALHRRRRGHRRSAPVRRR
jgi:signal recognition particle GTPase